MRRLLLAGLVALPAVVPACSEEESLPSDTRAPVLEVSGPVTAAPGRPFPPAVTSLQGAGVALEEVARLDSPTAMAVRPGVDDRVYVAERPGVVRELVLGDGGDGPAEVVAEPVIDISGDVSVESERGLLGLAFSPAGDRLYLSYTNDHGDTRVDELAFDDEGVDESSRRIMFALDQPYANHNGGEVTFGPDGFLYLGLGDGGGAGDPVLAGQDRGQLLGSLIRIDPRGVDGSAYVVPADNPYARVEGGRPEVWLKGVRNPWRFSFDPATGDLWIGDVGQNEVEEVDWLPAGPDGTGAGRGANLGWNEMEGDQPYEDGVRPADATDPVVTYHHDGGGCSVVGGYVYRGRALARSLAGAYLYTDYCLGDLRAALLTAGGDLVDDVDLGAAVERPVSFGQDAHGELYVLSLDGAVSRLVATP